MTISPKDDDGRFAGSLALIAGLLLSSPHAFAANRDVFGFNSVAIPCWIENEKVIAVVNSTGKTLASGTALRIQAVRSPDGEHFVLNKKMGQTPSGTVIRFGAVPSSGCTATVRSPRPVLRTQ